MSTRVNFDKVRLKAYSAPLPSPNDPPQSEPNGLKWDLSNRYSETTHLHFSED
jgi:hypothetical protein